MLQLILFIVVIGFLIWVIIKMPRKLLILIGFIAAYITTLAYIYGKAKRG